MDTYKFPANITNCSNNYGPYQFPEKLIPLIINNALARVRNFRYMAMERMFRDWLYVDGSCQGNRHGTGERQTV